MSLATLPASLFAQVMHWLYPPVTRWDSGVHSRYVLHWGRGVHLEWDTKAALQCFSALSKSLHAMVRESSELYVYAESMEWSLSTTRKFHPALALTCSRLVADGRLASLLASSFRNATTNLVLVDLRATAITDVSLVTILQTCPSLKELDVGECQNFSVLKLARHL